MLVQPIGARRERDAPRAPLRVAVDARGNQREGHALAPVLGGEVERAGVAAREELGLPARPAIPNVPDRVDHAARLQREAGGYDRAARVAAADLVARLLQLAAPRRGEDGPTHSPAGAQAAVRRV